MPTRHIDKVKSINQRQKTRRRDKPRRTWQSQTHVFARWKMKVTGKKWLSTWLLCFTIGGSAERPGCCSVFFLILFEDNIFCLTFFPLQQFFCCCRLKIWAFRWRNTRRHKASNSIKFSPVVLCWITKEWLFVRMEYREKEIVRSGRSIPHMWHVNSVCVCQRNHRS